MIGSNLTVSTSMATSAAANARAADGDYKTKGPGHTGKDADGDYKPTPAVSGASASPAARSSNAVRAALTTLNLGG